MNSNQEDKRSPSGSRSPTRKLNLLGQGKALNASQKKAAEDQYNKIRNVMKNKDNQQPSDQINHFISVTEINKMITTAMQPTLDQIPRMQLDIKTHYSQIRELKMANSNHKKEFESISEQFKELNVLDKNINSLANELKKSQAINSDKYTVNSNEISRAGMEIREIKEKVDKITTSMDRKEEQMAQKHHLLDTKHTQFTERFDEIFEGINKDRKNVGFKIRNLEANMDRAQKDLCQITEDVQKVVNENINQIFNKHLDHEKQFMSINRMMRDYENTKKKLARLDYIVQDVQDRANDDVIVTNYMLKGLPALIHFQICEGLEKVVGQDYMQQFVEFSRVKTKELQVYFKKDCNQSCIRSTIERCNALMKWYVEKDLGTLPFVYGVDLRSKMSEEDQKHIKQDKEKQLVGRLQKVQQQDRLLKDMFDLVTKENDRNEVVIEHSLKKFPSDLVVKLSNKLLEFKVIKQGKYEELDCIHRAAPEPRVESQQSMPRGNNQGGGNLNLPTSNMESNGQLSARGKRQPSAAGRKTTQISVGQVNKLLGPPQTSGNTMMGRRGQQQGGTTFPERIFMIHKQEMRPYKVLDTMWKKKFDKILIDYSLYKSRQLKNVNQFTKMQVDLCKEMEQNKTILKDFQDQFDLFEEEEFKRWDKLTEEKNDQVTQIKKQFNAVEDWQQECEFQMQKSTKTQKETKLKFESQLDHLTQRNIRLETQLDKLKEDIKREMKRAAEGGRDSSNHSHGGRSSSKSRSSSIMVSCGGGAGHSHNEHKDKRRESKRVDVGGPAKTTQIYEESVVEERSNESEQDLTGESEDAQSQDSGHNIFGEGIQMEVDVKHLQKATTNLARKKQIQIKKKPDEEGKQETEEDKAKKLKRQNMSIKQQQRAKIQEKLEIKKRKAEEAELKKAEREEKAAIERKVQKQKEIEHKRLLAEEAAEDLINLRKEEEKQQRLARRANFQKAQDGFQKGTNLLMKINKMMNKESKKSGNKGLASRTSSKMSLVRAPTIGSKMSQIQQIGVFQNAFGAEQMSSQHQNTVSGDESPLSRDRHSAWESSNSDSDYSESIAGIFGGGRKKKTGPPGLQEEQVREILDEELTKLKHDFQSVVAGRITSLQNRLDNGLNDMKTKLEQNSKAQMTKLGTLEGQFELVKNASGKILTQTDFKMKSFTEQLENESRELHKLKIGMKNTIKEELHRMDSLYNMSEYEFKRINSCLKFNSKILQLILEDSMINQLIQEQEIEDRKQIGLFGMKKNSEIMGVNQGALTNAYNRQGSTKKISKTDQWALPNKDLALSEVLHPNENKDSRMKFANQTIDQLQTISETTSKTPALRITDKKIDFTQNLGQAQNTIKIDKNCASCSGNVSQVLTQVKLACLSYTNTPIQFGTSKLLNSDLIAVKEMILKKCEIFSSTMDELNQYGSVFGILGPNNDKNVDQWIKMVKSNMFKCSKNKHAHTIDIPVSGLNSESLTPQQSQMPISLNIQSRGKLQSNPSKHKMEVKISSSKIETVIRKEQSPTYIDIDGTQEHSKNSISQLHDDSERETKNKGTGMQNEHYGSNRIINEGIQQQVGFENISLAVDIQVKENQPHTKKFKIDTLNRLIVQKKGLTGESKRYEQANKMIKQMNAQKPIDQQLVIPHHQPQMCPLFLGEKDDVQNDLAHILDGDLDDEFTQLSYSLLSPKEKLNIKTEKINRDVGVYDRTKKLLINKSHEKTIDSHRKKTPSVRTNHSKKSVSRLKTPSQGRNFQTIGPQTQKHSSAVNRNQLNLHVSSQGDFMVLGGQQEPPKTQADASAIFMQRRISNRKNAQDINQMLQNETFESVTQTSHRHQISKASLGNTARINKKFSNQSRGVTPGCNGLGTQYMVSSPPVKHRAKTPSSINIANRPTHAQAINIKMRGEQQTPIAMMTMNNNFQTQQSSNQVGQRNNEQNLWSLTSQHMLSQTFTQSNQDQASGTFAMKRNTVYSGLQNPQYGLQHVSSGQNQNFQVPDKIYVTLLDEEINSNQQSSPISASHEKTDFQREQQQVQIKTFSYPHDVNSVTIELPDQNDDIINQSQDAYRRQMSGATAKTEYMMNNNPQVSNERRQDADELVDEISLPVNK